VESQESSGRNKEGKMENIDVLVEQFKLNKLSPCFLFYGEDEEELLRFAIDLAVIVLSKSEENPQGLDNSFTRKYIEEKTHPNFFLLEPKEREITVDEARKMNAFLQSTPTLRGWRFVVVRHADFLNLSAGNAILKTLEELPKKTSVVLTANCLYKIRKTLLSRTQKFFFKNKETKQEYPNDLYTTVQEKILNAVLFQKIPDKTFFDLVTTPQNLEILPKIITEILYKQATEMTGLAGGDGGENERRGQDVEKIKIFSEKYHSIAEFLNEAEGKALSPQHFALAIFSIIADRLQIYSLCEM
jgi:DNA polymerase III delta prime subunit